MGKDFRIIVAGGRKFNDYKSLTKVIDKYIKDHKVKADDSVTIVCGCAEGADDLGRKYAKEKGYNVEEFPANWNMFGKVAGILRNKEMARYASDSTTGDGHLIVFWNGKSKGSKNMIDTAIGYNIPILICSYKDTEYNTEDIISEYIDDMDEVIKEIFDEKDSHFQVGSLSKVTDIRVINI